MKNFFSLFTVSLLLSTGLAAAEKNGTSLAQFIYDPSQQMTKAGKIVAIEKIDHSYGRSPGIHLTLQANGKQIPVHLGPEWYLNQIGLVLKEGQEIKVEGAYVAMEGGDAFIAFTIEVDGNKYPLRDAQGVPLWRGSWR